MCFQLTEHMTGPGRPAGPPCSPCVSSHIPSSIFYNKLKHIQDSYKWSNPVKGAGTPMYSHSKAQNNQDPGSWLAFKVETGLLVCLFWLVSHSVAQAVHNSLCSWLQTFGNPPVSVWDCRRESPEQLDVEVVLAPSTCGIWCYLQAGGMVSEWNWHIGHTVVLKNLFVGQEKLPDLCCFALLCFVCLFVFIDRLSCSSG